MIGVLQASARMKTSEYHETDEISRVDGLIQKITYFIYFVSDFDPLSIYKGDYKYSTRSKYQFYLRSELKLELNKLDKWRKWFRIRLVVVYVLLMIKFATICLVQLAKYRATAFIRNNTTMTSFDVIPEVHETDAIKILKKIYLDDFAGNLLSDSPSAAFFVYATMLLSISYSVYYLPHYYTIKPADAPDLRLAVAPAQERNRIDLLLWENVKQLILVRADYKRTLSESWTEFCHTSDGRALNCSFLESMEPQQEIQVSFTFDELLRPARYWTGCATYWRTVRRLIVAVVTWGLSFAATIYYNVTEWTIKFSCEIKQIPASDCNLVNALNAGQIYSLVELNFAVILLGVFLCKSLLTFLAHLEAQLHSTREMEQDLDNLLLILQTLNGNKSTPNSAGNARMKHIKVVDMREAHLSDALLKMLAKMNYLLAESRSRALFMSEQVSCFVVTSGVATVLAIMAFKIEGPDIEILRTNFIRCLWLVANIVMMICAHEYAKMIHLQRTGWRIAAQLSIRLARDYEIEGHGLADRKRGPYPDPITSSWLNLIRTGYLLDVRHSVRPFNVSLNYKRILQVNFYVTSLAAIVFR